ncbi:transposable element P transposase [Elysia marginata]|uniref:Transposable element P transposase n=1 Tax=Elysia marginata TaxID=1093978 RepID=A0AAV4HTD3_9GAST|nr:transposable element P transposase [Elysia marginata]
MDGMEKNSTNTHCRSCSAVNCTNSKRKLLTKTAVPTLFNIPNPPAKRTPSRASTKKCLPISVKKPLPPSESSSPLAPSTSSSSSPASSSTLNSVETPESPRKKSLKRKLQQERTKTSRLRKKVKLMESSGSSNTELETLHNAGTSDLDTLKNLLSKYLSPAAYNFVMTQVRVAGLLKYARRWTNREKSFALALYHGSRKAYYLLQKIFSLPSPRTLAAAMKNINI